MTRATPPAGPAVPEPTVSELHALYHEAAAAEPEPALDRTILDAARRELQTGRAARRPTPWWRGWLPVASAIAVAAVGLSLTWRVMDEQERHLRAEMSAAEAARETAATPAPAQPPAAVMPSLDAVAPAIQGRRIESTAPKDAPVLVPEPAAQPAPSVPAAMAPASADGAMKKSQRAEANELRQRRDADAASMPAFGPARQAGKLEAGSLGAGESAAESVAKPSAKSVAGSVLETAADAATPEAWLKHIRELRAAGHGAEAAQSLVRFRARYPDFALPDDLR